MVRGPSFSSPLASRRYCSARSSAKSSEVPEIWAVSGMNASAPSERSFFSLRACLSTARTFLGLCVKVVELGSNCFLGIANLLLNDAIELLYRAFSLLEVVVRENAPSFLRPSFDLVPFAFGLILVHLIALSFISGHTYQQHSSQPPNVSNC